MCIPKISHSQTHPAYSLEFQYLILQGAQHLLFAFFKTKQTNKQWLALQVHIQYKKHTKFKGKISLNKLSLTYPSKLTIPYITQLHFLNLNRSIM